MRKGVNLIVRVWVEGEDEPAHDFAASAVEMVREIHASGRSKKYPQWKAEIKKVSVEEGSSDDDA